MYVMSPVLHTALQASAFHHLQYEPTCVATIVVANYLTLLPLYMTCHVVVH